MPMKPPRPLASSPTSSDMTTNLINLSTKGYWFTCIELRLVDIAASLDIQVKSRRPVSSPVCFLRGFLNESKWSVDGEKAGWAKSWGTWHCREAYNRSSRWVSTNAPRQEEKVWRKTHQQSLWQGILIVGYILYPGAGINPIDDRWPPSQVPWALCPYFL